MGINIELIKGYGNNVYIQSSLIGLPKELNLVKEISNCLIPHYYNEDKDILLGIGHHDTLGIVSVLKLKNQWFYSNKLLYGTEKMSYQKMDDITSLSVQPIAEISKLKLIIRAIDSSSDLEATFYPFIKPECYHA